ncbi:MAG: 16S rRNA (cytidine(1402)-2'-O)-methyltransferase [Pseudomonadota bacterium]
MSHQQIALRPALYLVATPIGNARDITLRALDVLASADVLAAEDTRTLQKLLQIHGIARNGRDILSYHDHSKPAAAEALVNRVAEGQSVAYASDAGTPMLSDPGYGLVRAAVHRELSVVPLPGPSAALAAAVVAGLPTDRLMFLGFPPTKAAARKAWLSDVAHTKSTLVIYESPRRVGDLLRAMQDVFGGDREVVLCRELTKKFEETRRFPLSTAVEEVGGESLKGECVLVVSGASHHAATDDDIRAALFNALQRSSVKDAVAEVSHSYRRPRKEVYGLALALTKSTDGD